MGLLGPETTVTIKTSEYAVLLKSFGQMESFKGFVKKQKYSISREDCASILGFELTDKEVENAGTD